MRRYSIAGFVLTAGFVVSTSVLAHEDGDLSPIGPPGKPRNRVQALNGYRDGLHAQALNGFRDGSRAQALNGYRDSSGAKALNGFRDDAGAKALNGYRDDAGAKALNGYRDGSGVKALNGFRDEDDPLTSWISSERALQEDRLELAHYIVQCAMAPGDDRAVHVGGETYTLRGGFGLLPAWTSGEAMTDSENEILTACLGAHVNPLGKHVPISIRGPGMRLDEGEAELFPVRE